MNFQKQALARKLLVWASQDEKSSIEPSLIDELASSMEMSVDRLKEIEKQQRELDAFRLNAECALMQHFYEWIEKMESQRVADAEISAWSGLCQRHQDLYSWLQPRWETIEHDAYCHQLAQSRQQQALAQSMKLARQVEKTAFEKAEKQKTNGEKNDEKASKDDKKERDGKEGGQEVAKEGCPGGQGEDKGGQAEA